MFYSDMLRESCETMQIRTIAHDTLTQEETDSLFDDAAFFNYDCAIRATIDGLQH